MSLRKAKWLAVVEVELIAFNDDPERPDSVNEFYCMVGGAMMATAGHGIDERSFEEIVTGYKMRFKPLTDKQLTGHEQRIADLERALFGKSIDEKGWVKG